MEIYQSYVSLCTFAVMVLAATTLSHFLFFLSFIIYFLISLSSTNKLVSTNDSILQQSQQSRNDGQLCYGMLWTLTIFLLFLWFYINFVLFCFCFYFWWWRGTWHCSHMICHMMWHYRPRTWWKDLEDDVRAHRCNMVALSKTWDKHEDKA